MAAAAEEKTVRLHVGGLTPNITPEHLLQRFKIFGQVDEVETLAPDGLGQQRSFAYVTLRATPAQLRKCLNTLSGSMYRGAQLRIAEARPRYAEKIAKENAPSALEVQKDQLRARKRARLAMGPDVGRTAQNMDLITLESYKRSKFWNETPTRHLIRPLAIRPTHPLPPAIAAVDSTALQSSGKPAAKIPAGKAEDSKKKTVKPGSALKRQRLRVINPFMWAPTHLGEAILSGGQPMAPLDQRAETRGQEWAFVSAEDAEEAKTAEDAEGEDETILLGYWRNSSTGESQAVRGKKHILPVLEAYEDAELEADEDLFDFGTFGGNDGGDGVSSPLFGGRDIREESQAEDGETVSSMLFPSVRGAGEVNRSPSPLFGARPSEASAPAQEVEMAESTESEQEPEAGVENGSRASSPLFASHRSARSNTADETAVPIDSKPITKPAISSDLLDQVKVEQKRDLGLIDSLVQTIAPNDTILPLEAKPVVKGEWWGYDESDDEDDHFYEQLKAQQKAKADAADSQMEGVDAEDQDSVRGGAGGPLRLRGGGPAPGEEQGGDEADDDSDDSDSDSDSSSDSSDSDSDSDSDSESDSSDSGSDSSSSSSSSSSSESSSSSSSSSSPSSDSDDDDDEDEESTAAPGAVTGGFSLAAIADIEMDELDIPLNTGPGVVSIPEGEVEPLTAMTRKQLFDPSPSIPLFFLPPASATQQIRPGWAVHPSQYDYGSAGPAGMAAGYGAPLGASVPPRNGYEEPSYGQGANAAPLIKKRKAPVPFHRPNKQTDEHMKERWESVRRQLTGEWKVRGREARKQRRRRGGGDDD